MMSFATTSRIRTRLNGSNEPVYEDLITTNSFICTPKLKVSESQKRDLTFDQQIDLAHILTVGLEVACDGGLW